MHSRSHVNPAHHTEPAAQRVAESDPWMSHALAGGGGNAMMAASMSTSPSRTTGADVAAQESPDWAADLDASDEGLLAGVIGLVDRLVVPGAGISASGALEATLLLAVGAVGGSVTLTNAGGGFVSLAVAFDAGFGVGVGLGGNLLGQELELGGQGLATTASAIEILLPWSELAGGELLAALGAAASAADVMAVFASLLTSIEGLGRYVVSVESGLGMELGGGLEADLGGVGSAEATALHEAGAAFSVTWDTAESIAGGARTGVVEISATVAVLSGLGAKIPWLASLDLPLIDGAGAVTVSVPQTQAADGAVTFGAPSAAFGVTLGTGGTTVGVEHSLGGENQTTLTLGVSQGGFVTEAAAFAASMVGLDGPGDANIGAELSLAFDLGRAADAGYGLGAALARWLVGGEQAPDPALLGGQTADALLAAADVALSVDAEWIVAAVDGGLELDAGVGLGLEGEMAQSLVYTSDDVLPEIGRPAPAEILRAARENAA